MSKKAFRSDENGEPLFICSDGSYTNTFPREHIVRSNAETDNTHFVVYGFVGDNQDYEEQEWEFEEEDAAVEFATEIYGSEAPEEFSKDGEVFEVEVHERDD